MHATEKSAWQALVSGQQAAARLANTVRRPVPPREAFERLVTLQRLAGEAGRVPAEGAPEENLLFHLRWCTLRRRVLGE